MSTSPTALTMQGAIMTLQTFWSEHDCAITQPMNTEVGAGTANPSTLMRVLGPEPWRVAYVEPSVRPDDSRYGDNPNRLQTHTQYQVILKPEPGNPQELFLQSLEALGIDLHAHDVRFVEDNWASPSLGAWGLGWEVWLDGLEITQFTYFQQAGGMMLEPVACEITYGLERILMALQGVSHFKDIQFNDELRYGEMFAQAEYEMSAYYLDEASIPDTWEMYRLNAAEAQRMIDRRLPVPAYSLLLKCSHLFNILDARGAISTTERATSFKTMRTLSRAVSELWVERRVELDYPLGVTPEKPAAELPGSLPTITEPATLLFEVGVEELPWADVDPLAEQLRTAVAEQLDKTRLAHGTPRAWSTPRRLVLVIPEVAPGEPSETEFVKGPRASAAFDGDGNPTKAAQGFCRSKGVSPEELERREIDGAEYVGVSRQSTGRTAAEVLSPLLAGVVSSLRAPKNMRWEDPELSFARPIRWLLSLLGDQHLPVAVSGLASATTTRVLRTAEQVEVPVPGAEGYAEFLATHGIILDGPQRQSLIWEGAVQAAAETGDRPGVDQDSDLVREVASIVEAPHVLVGNIDEQHMTLPDRVLTTVMTKHQRYLPVVDGDGQLQPRFLAVPNGPCDPELVRQGNESVLRARFEDASFFLREDLKTSPEDFRGRLGGLTFETTLGSVSERADRIAGQAVALAAAAGLDAPTADTVARASGLAKFDLATQMVIEFSSLAGVMAAEYARRAGEPEPVCTALAEMEQPHSAGDAIPATPAGQVLSLADRFDLLTGMLAIGNAPTGRSDPFGVRRAAIGILAVLRHAPLFADLRVGDGIGFAIEQLTRQGVSVPADLTDTAVQFLERRFELQLLDAGHLHQHVQAVLVHAERPALADRNLEVLERLAGDTEFQQLTEAIQRIERILPATDPPEAPAALTEPAERALADAVAALPALDEPLLDRYYEQAKGLVAPINQFFEDVLVMDPDPSVRSARLRLLAEVVAPARRVLRWSALT